MQPYNDILPEPAANNAYAYENDGFEVIGTHISGGVVYRHIQVDITSKDYVEILDVSMNKAALGCIVHILPILNEGDSLRDIIFKGAKHLKCPDIKIDGCFTEIKTPTSGVHANKICNNIKIAHHQADGIIIRLNEEFDVKRLKEIAKSRFKLHVSLKSLEFKVNGVYYCFKRGDFI